MRVNISFSVELDEVPKKVMGFIEEGGEQLQDTAEFIEDIMSMMGAKNYLGSIEEIAKLRDLMAIIDYRLEDCMQILGGYTKTLADMPKQKREPSRSSVTPEQIAKFEEDLKKLREDHNDDTNTEEGG